MAGYIMKNLKYSHKDFTHKSFLKENSKDFEGEIVGSCFYHEGELSEIFPKDIQATFINCNLDNVIIPAGCKVIGGTNKEIKAVDGADWVCDKGVTLSRLSEVQ